MDEPEKKERSHTFRLFPSSDAMLEKCIQYAHKAGIIVEPSLQCYIEYALNLAYANLQDYERQRKGIKTNG